MHFYPNEIYTGKITTKGQTTIPSAVRLGLGLNSGDELIYEKLDDKYIIRKAKPLDVAYYRGIQQVFAEEWGSKEDNEAYNDL